MIRQFLCLVCQLSILFDGCIALTQLFESLSGISLLGLIILKRVVVGQPLQYFFFVLSNEFFDIKR